MERAVTKMLLAQKTVICIYGAYIGEFKRITKYCSGESWSQQFGAEFDMFVTYFSGKN